MRVHDRHVAVRRRQAQHKHAGGCREADLHREVLVEKPAVGVVHLHGTGRSALGHKKNLAVGWQLLARARIERNRKRLEVVDVRLKSARGGGVSKNAGARAGARADVGHVSPQQGDLVQLTLVPQLTSGHDDAPTVAARVEGGCQKPHSAVARLVLKVG